MAKIIQGNFAKMTETATGVTEYTTEQADVLIDNYWGYHVGDKFFIATIPYIDKLFEDCKKIALRVADIDDPQRLKASWIPYNGQILRKDKNKDNVYYFIIDEKTYSGDAGLRNGTDTNCLIARLGEDEGEYYVFFYASNIELGVPGGTGNSTGSPGIKVPSPPPPPPE